MELKRAVQIAGNEPGGSAVSDSTDGFPPLLALIRPLVKAPRMRQWRGFFFSVI
jgi:hypothetical protein